ncbi:TPA: hypothetical protein DDZ86_00270 [Candidatus Dependentiae bacterium]|nr:MAG: General secretion pathway protein F [candidate division TM6 bacterium GW2011_GWF2_43_87]HBL98063.1 hypothetical protein [Candidatus Dependentiae bacterium]
MALYIYHAFSRDGKKVAGSLDASSTKQVREQLMRSGLFVVSINLASEEAKKSFSFKQLFEKSVTVKDKIFFTRQLGVLLRSGIPIVDALTLLVDQTEGQLRNISVALRDGLKEGRSLAEGLAAYPKVFEPLYIQLIRAGEASGKLELVLDRLTNYLEKQQELSSKITGALTYPIIQLSIVLIIVTGLLTVVVPPIAKIFEDQKAELPFATRLLVGISNFLTGHYILLAFIFVGGYLAFRFWKATPAGAYRMDTIKLHVPIIKYFARMGAVVQFSRTLGLLLEAGVGLSESLDIVCNIVDNKVLVKALKSAREQIIKQGKVAEYLKKTDIFPSMAIYLINTGEQSGKLDAMLTAVAQHYEGELNEWSDGLVARLDPIMMVVMAGVVGFVIIAIMKPILGLSTALGG